MSTLRLMEHTLLDDEKIIAYMMNMLRKGDEPMWDKIIEQFPKLLIAAGILGAIIVGYKTQTAQTIITATLSTTTLWYMLRTHIKAFFVSSMYAFKLANKLTLEELQEEQRKTKEMKHKIEKLIKK